MAAAGKALIASTGGEGIAVLMPCFNTRPDHLHAAVASVAVERDRLSSLGVSMQLVVVDDASPNPATRGALDEVETLGDWITVVRQQRNLGSSAARNRALSMVTQPWIAFLDSDDHWVPGGLTRLYIELRAHPQLDWISGDFHYQYGDASPETALFYPHHPQRFRHVQAGYKTGEVVEVAMPAVVFLEDTLCSMGSCLIRREKLAEVGGFQTSLSKGDDTELYWRLARVCRFGFAPWAVFNYRRRVGSQTGDSGLLSSWEPSVLGRMLNEPYWADYVPQIRARLLRSLHAAVRYHRRKRDRLSAARAVLQVLRHDFANVQVWRHLVAILTVG